MDFEGVVAGEKSNCGIDIGIFEDFGRHLIQSSSRPSRLRDYLVFESRSIIEELWMLTLDCAAVFNVAIGAALQCIFCSLSPPNESLLWLPYCIGWFREVSSYVDLRSVVLHFCLLVKKNWCWKFSLAKTMKKLPRHLRSESAVPMECPSSNHGKPQHLLLTFTMTPVVESLCLLLDL